MINTFGRRFRGNWLDLWWCPTLRRRPQLAREPAARIRDHGVLRYHRSAVAALLALERAGAKTGWTAVELRQQHAMLPALRAAGPLDRGNLRCGHRFEFWHERRAKIGSFTESNRTMACSHRALCSKLLSQKNFICEGEGTRTQPAILPFKYRPFSPPHRRMRTCHGLTNLAGQPSMRMTNF